VRRPVGVTDEETKKKKSESEGSISPKSPLAIAMEEEESIVSTAPIYMTSQDDVNCEIELFATPYFLEREYDGMENREEKFGEDSEEKVVYGRSMSIKIQFTSPLPLPTTTFQSIREPFTVQDVGSNSNRSSLKIMTYNILADPYASSKFATETLYPYCPTEHLQPFPRSQLVILDLMTCRCEIICLQECDSSAFTCYYNPLLSSMGYQGIFTKKFGHVGEGIAMFIDRSAYSIQKVEDFKISDEILEDPQIKSLIQLLPEQKYILSNKITTAAQVIVLQPNNTSNFLPPLVVGNTHLFYHPDAPYVRALCTQAILNKMEALTLHPKEEYVRIMCGDFNSCPHNAPIQLMQGTDILPSDEIWHSLLTFSWFVLIYYYKCCLILFDLIIGFLI